MTNLKKNILYGLVFICFLLLGLLVSRAQANKAELSLATNGMSTSAREITKPKKVAVKKLLQHVTNKYSDKKVQIQFTNKSDINEIIIWANFDLTNLPIEKGRYLTKSDFAGHIPFALCTKNSTAEIEEIQKNQYILYDNAYISVVGSLKEGYVQDNYYITTGINQFTNRFNLPDYTLVIDGLSKTEYADVAKFVSGKVKQPAFIKEAVKNQNNPIVPFALAILLIVMSGIIVTFLAIITRKMNKETQLRDRLFKNLQVNLAVRFGGFTLLLATFALIISYYFFYFSQINQLIWLLATLLVLLNINFDIIVLRKSSDKSTN